MNPNKALWEKGDFTEIAALMRHSGEAVAKSLGITPPLRVLDLGCGDGTTAVPLARLGADVVGIDIARNLVDAGNRRAAEAGLDRLKFQEGDACDLQGVGDHSFDLTLSVFGAMFAPKPLDVAKEMVRVTKPGGRIVMGNWIPNDPTFVSQVLKISSAFTPPPPPVHEHIPEPAQEPESEGTPDFDVNRLTPEEQELHRRANRVAKVSMQDIKMLRPDQVRLGRENKDICVRLKDDIEKAHREYDRRFKPIMDHPVDYFYRWMVEILAEGDAGALGEYPYAVPARQH